MFFEVYIFYLVSTKNNISSFGRGGRKAQSFHETIADLPKAGACERPRVRCWERNLDPLEEEEVL